MEKRYRQIGAFLQQEIDEQCIILIDAMNKLPGIETTESCSGHGKEPMSIYFNVANLDCLPKLLYWFDDCHNGVESWSITAKTDCAMSPVYFCARSQTIGEEAYKNAITIAALLEQEAIK